MHPTTPPTTPSRRPPRSPAAKHALLIEDIEDDEETLVEDFGVEGAAAEEVLRYDPDNDEEEADDEEEDGDEDGDEGEPDLEGHSDEELDLDDDKAFEKLRKRVRLEATRQSEATCRVGGIKTQLAMIRAWEVRFHASFFSVSSELMKKYRNLLKCHRRRKKSATT